VASNSASPAAAESPLALEGNDLVDIAIDLAHRFPVTSVLREAEHGLYRRRRRSVPKRSSVYPGKRLRNAKVLTPPTLETPRRCHLLDNSREINMYFLVKGVLNN
jgi:hypothetical protein